MVLEEFSSCEEEHDCYHPSDRSFVLPRCHHGEDTPTGVGHAFPRHRVEANNARPSQGGMVARKEDRGEGTRGAGGGSTG